MKTYADYIGKFFPGIKVQKISVDAGFTCPNRDGSIAVGGCIYCRNDSFSPSYCDPARSVGDQLSKGIDFFSRKYPKMKYLAYFQSYTGTYNKEATQLEKIYREALNSENVVGLVIATRPDCLPHEITDLLSQLNSEKPVFMELGVETSFDSTLKLINRNHTWQDVVDAVSRLTQKGLHCGVHLIAGLPGENRQMILSSVKKICSLSIETIKLHQLQVLKDTVLFEKIKNGEISVPDYTLEEYLDICAEIVKIVPENIIIERFVSQSPPHLVVSPKWGLKNYEFITKLAKILDN